MKRSPKTTIIAVVLTLCCSAAGAAEQVIGRFSAGDLAGWEEQTFRGKAKTVYAIVREGERSVLRAESRAAASGLLRKVTIDPKTYPILRWSWKIRETLPKGDERTKGGDDYAARVYVVFPRTFFWQTRAINYIWANRLPKGQSLPNAYTGNVMMVAVESGSGSAGRWLAEERNIREDYRQLFGEEPPDGAAVAVMTDTDNTGGEATAWYGDIRLSEK